MYYIKNTDRLDIVVEESKMTILIQQKWQYDWLSAPGTTPWTYSQKKEFHNAIDKLIWSQWGSHITLEAQGNSSFAKKHAGTNFKLEFDIKWVVSNPHWQAKIKKIVPGSFETSNVMWDARVINLDTEDIKLRKVAAGFYQYPAAHEFGHAVGNSIYAYPGAHGDEYNATSAYHADSISMMNIGSKLRGRHIDFVIRELNIMIPQTTFHIHHIR